MTNRYRNDHWTIEDKLGIAGTGDVLARMALEVRPPFSIRVTGKWGAGKTSVLRRAFVTLGGQPVQQAVPLGEDKKEADKKDWEKWSYEKTGRVPALDWPEDIKHIAKQSLCIWYSPWQHQGTDNPLIPLLLEIQAQFSTFIRIREGAKKINRQGGLATLTLLERVVDAAASLTIGKGVKMATGTTDAVRKAWNEAAPQLTKLSDGQRFHLLFEDAVKNALESLSDEQSQDKNLRMIIFIDDLDRCEESVIVELLESIKLYLTSPHCVFVLGVDDTAVLGAMKRHWETRSEDDNREYLEKMFQATISVPLPRPSKISDTIADQLKAHDFPAHKKCAETIEKLLEPNPRKIKNFCNSLCAAWNQFGGDENQSEGDARQFILFYYLRLCHRPVWRILERQPYALVVLHRVLNNLSDSESFPQIEGFGKEEQRMLEELFSRAFLHVLGDDKSQAEDYRLFHRNMSLDQAVTVFEERLDRKRSDEYFINLFRELIGPDKVLDGKFLYLPKPAEESPAS